MTSLFDPLRLGALELPHRLLMAPMTRARGTRDHLPTEIMVDYYAQRASAGLIISEAIGITQQGLGWAYATGLWSPAQIAGWKRITDAVHAAGGTIIAQLWHMGRVVHPSFLGAASPFQLLLPRRQGSPIPMRASSRMHRRVRLAWTKSHRFFQIFTGHPKRHRCGLRRRAGPCCQRLSDRPVHA
jgi:2,4-dienoyl-CoA reductase-like NADH-dependent reductase (Old Yellow Enzyme family)